MKKTVAISLAVLLVCLIAVGSTIAWLTDEASVTNTFTVGKIDVSLQEPAWQTSGNKIYPGAEIVKDPTIMVKADSEDCYVYAVIDNQLNGAVPCAVTLGVPTDWTLIETLGTKTLYRYGAVVELHPSDQPLTPLFEAVSVSTTVVTQDNIACLTDKQIIVKAFAHQANATTQANADAAARTHFGM